MIENHQILVLSSLKFSEDKLIVNALSRSAGRVTLMVNISHSQRASVHFTLFQPLALLDVSWEVTPRTKMFKPKTARPSVQLHSLQSDPVKSTIVMFLAEFLLNATRIESDGGLLFDYISAAIQWLDEAEKDFANFHIVFLLRLSQFLGIQPNLEDDSDEPYFDLQGAEYVSRRPDHTYYISGEDLKALRQLVRMNFGTMHLFQLSGNQRNRILHFILTYYRLHLPNFPELKSLAILQAIFR